MLKPEIKEKWIAALLSGEYKQGSGALRTPEHTYCCLGVLCDIYAKETNTEWRVSDVGLGYIDMYDTHDFGSAPMVGMPGDVVRTWAGIPTTMMDDDLYHAWHMLPIMNDKDGSSFEQIADFIKEKL